jgi:hypothetical protein
MDMRKFILKTVVVSMALMLVSNLAWAQPGFTYQAVAVDESRTETFGQDSRGEILVNQQLGVRFSIREGSETGEIKYTELHQTTTDIFGIFRLVVGRGTAQTGTPIVDLAWGQEKYFLQVEIDLGSGFILMGAEELVGSPYALNSAPQTLGLEQNTLTISKGNAVELSDNDPINELQALTKNGTQITLSKNGGTVSVADNDNDSGNEIQDLILNGSQLSITGKANATTVNLAPYLGNNLTEEDVDNFVSNNGYLTTEGDGSTTNEIQDLNLTGDALTITNNDQATTIDLTKYLDDTTLDESQVDAFVSDNGYLSAEVDGSTSNEIQDLNLTGDALTITNNVQATTIDLSKYLDDTTLDESQVDAFVNDNGYLTSEVDGSITNEIQDLAVLNNILTITGNASAANINLSPYLDAAFRTTANVTSNAPGSYVTDDFVFGSPQLSHDGDATHNSRMFFDKSKGAFRAGIEGGTDWDDNNVGSGSVAFSGGRASGSSSFALGSSIASGHNSVAIGSGNTASGAQAIALGIASSATSNDSFAFGNGSQAINNFAIAMGWSATASGYASISIGSQSTSGGTYAVSIGQGNNAGGAYALAFGRSTIASGYAATATGDDTQANGMGAMSSGAATTASGSYSFAGGLSTVANNSASVAFGQSSIASGARAFTMGMSTQAIGNNSLATGIETRAHSFAETTIGAYTTTYAPISTLAFQSMDRLFTIGNGVDNANRSNALIMLKNGNTRLHGQLTIDADNVTGAGESYTLPAQDGNANQVMTTDGNGNVTWMDAVDELTEADVDDYVSDNGYLTAEVDGSITNEIQDLALNSNTLTITNNAAATNIDLTPYLDAAFSTTLNITSNAPGSYATDDFVFGSPQLADNGNTSNNSRMFFDKSKGAFRAGIQTGTGWNDSNVGFNSVAFGGGRASGVRAAAFGECDATGDNSFSAGGNSVSSGLSAISLGYGSLASGDYSVALGGSAGASGASSVAIGIYTNASASGAFALGENANASAQSSVAIGYFAAASGSRSVAIGSLANASGQYAFATGIHTHATAFGATSMGLYNTLESMPSVTSYVSTDRLLVLGNGQNNSSRSDALIILKNGNTRLHGQLTIDADNVAGAGGDYTFPGQRGINGQVMTTNGSGILTWSTLPIPTITTTAGVSSNANGNYAVDDFVFGGPQLADNGNTSHDSRLFFDKSKGAFRAGVVASTQWNDSNVGNYSAAFGQNSTASGSWSFSAGYQSVASGIYATALGNSGAYDNYATAVGGSTASGVGSFAAGFSTASADYSTAIGSGGHANGVSSVALGPGTTYGEASFAFGFSSISNGRFSVVAGLGAIANSYGETALGMYTLNQPALNASAYNAADKLLVIGNGVDLNNRSNALVMLKTGATSLHGLLTIDADNVTGAGEAYTLPGQDGSANQILTTDGNGNVSWAAPGGGAQDLELDAITHVLNITGNAAASDIDLTSYYNVFETTGNVTSNENGNYASDDFVFGSPQLANDGNSSHNSRMFFDKSKGAFRAGNAFGSQWDDANVGEGSVAFGPSTTASGLYSFAIGSGGIASGSSSFAAGQGGIASAPYSAVFGGSTQALGFAATAFGDHTSAMGSRSFAAGQHSTAGGSNAAAFGNLTNASGSASVAFGDQNTASGFASFVAGTTSTASGHRSMAMGTGVTASGLHSVALNVNSQAQATASLAAGHYSIAGAYGEMALGLYNTIDPLANPTSIISSNRLLTIGNGTLPGLRSDALIILKNGNTRLHGQLTIDADNVNGAGESYTLPAQDGNANQVMTTDGNGNVTWQNVIAAEVDGSVTNEIQNLLLTNDILTITSDPDVNTIDLSSYRNIFETTSNITSNENGDYVADDFVFGSPSLDDDGDATHDTRMFFDKSTGAFRAGTATDTEWNATERGVNSVAIGNGSVARGDYSVAFGLNNLAHASSTVAIGTNIQAEGYNSIAIGRDVATTGVHSMALAFNSSARSFGETTMGVNATDNPALSITGWDVNDRLFTIGNGNPFTSTRSNALVIYKDGNATLSGTLTQNSDIRLKRNIKPLSNSLSTLLNLRGLHYQWNNVKPKDTLAMQTGLIAQDLERFLPELVTTDDQGYKSVNYIGLIPHLIESVKELDSKNDQLTQENQSLKSELQRIQDATDEKLKKLEARMQALEASTRSANGGD